MVFSDITKWIKQNPILSFAGLCVMGVALFFMIKYVTDLFGAGTWGTGGNMVAWIICGVIGFGWLHTKEKAMHLAKLAQAQRHHEAQMKQAQDHHEEVMVSHQKIMNAVNDHEQDVDKSKQV